MFTAPCSCHFQMLITLPPRSVNGGSAVTIDQPSTGGGHVIISVPVQLNLRSGSNTITFGAGQSSKHAVPTGSLAHR